MTRSKASKPSKVSAKTSRTPIPPKSNSAEMNQATSDEFEREGMGIAPKE